MQKLIGTWAFQDEVGEILWDSFEPRLSCSGTRTPVFTLSFSYIIYGQDSKESFTERVEPSYRVVGNGNSCILRLSYSVWMCGCI
jgi:hypothetical protein